MNFSILLLSLLLTISVLIHVLMWLDNKRLQKRIEYLTNTFNHYYESSEKK